MSGSTSDDERRAAGLRLERAGEAELGFVMATERIDGFEALVGRWDEERHRAALADGRHAYFVGFDGAVPVGFVILRDWNAPEHVTLVKRIAVVRPGKGDGRRLLAGALDAVFRQTSAHRVWLGVYPENLRARRAYESVGFVVEGLARGSAFFGGAYRDEVVLALLRPEWLARRTRTEADPAVPAGECAS